MKKQFSKTVLFLILLVFSTSTLLAQENNQELKKEFQKMNDKMAEAMLNENNDAILAMYADDVISLPSYNPMLKGKSALKKQMEMDENDNMKMKDFELTTLEVFSSGDYAYEVGKYNLSMEMDGGAESWTDNGKYLTVYEKQSDGSWKVKVETWNTNNNPWQQMQEQSEMDQDKDMDKMHKDKMHDGDDEDDDDMEDDDAM